LKFLHQIVLKTTIELCQVTVKMPRYRRDSDGNGPTYKKGERVWVPAIKMEATVIEQILHHDGSETHYGNVKLKYDDGVEGISHCWQLSRVIK